jgi:hypothetical protein
MRTAVTSALVAAAAVLAVAPASAQSSAPADTAYRALAALPDWSGLWGHGSPLPDEWRRNPPPLKPEVAAANAAGAADTDPDLSRYCRPLQFTGSSGGFTEAVEFLFTPGRVTITNEMGLIRRIYTDGRPMPSNPDATNTGTSIGRWEGQTLIVETVGINPSALYPNTQQGAVPIGADARISERIHLTDANTLQFDIVTVAPDVLTAPDRRTRIYTRLAKTTPNEITFCADYDRSIDPQTGKQRFDMTPPADLPPPPRR